MNIKLQISQWKEELLAPNKTDVLVNLDPDTNALEVGKEIIENEKISLPIERRINKLFKAHQQSIKESGTPIFGVCKNTVKFDLDNRSYTLPLFIANCSIKKNRLNQNFDIEQNEAFYLNPYLTKLVNLTEEFEDTEQFQDWCSSNRFEIEISIGQWIANVHPHRFILVKELERIEKLNKLSHGTMQLLGDEGQDQSELDLNEGELFNSDSDQQAVYDKARLENLVVQGPPGTGKSQVITNLIGKAVANNNSTLLVAEKKVALQVIYDKLKSFDLHHFCLLHHHELNARDFIRSLEQTWNLLENRQKVQRQFSTPSKFALDGLDLTLERLRQPELIGGVNYSEFKSMSRNSNFKSVDFFADVPDIPTWKSDKEQLKKLEIEDLSDEWTYLKSSVFESDIAHLEKKLIKIRSLIEEISIPEISRKSIDEMMKKSGIASLFFYDDLLISPEIFKPNSSIQKKFVKHFNNLIKLTEECTALEDEKKHWKRNFSLSELQEYISVLASSSKFGLRSRFQRKKLLKYTDLDLKDARSTLQNLIDLKKKEDELIKTKQAIRKLGLSDDMGELEHINYVIRRSKQVDNNIIQELTKCTGEQLQEYKKLADQLSSVNSLIVENILIEPNKSIKPIIQKLISRLGKIAANLDSIKSISDKTKKVWRLTSSIKKAEDTILYSHWNQFSGRFPELAKMDNAALLAKLNNIIELKKAEHQHFGVFILDSIQQNFEDYSSLLGIPARKLNEEQKRFKKELRKGKSILVKAFAKKRVFPSIYDLLESEAKHWIHLLHPIFLCSPYTVARSLPIDHSFDLVIFDEASQIPLPHALGGVQRGKRIIVAGDSEQMAPSFYFQSKNTSTHDLLHQSSFYWRNQMLTNHYRSSHERLIAFSNKYFYEDKLTTFPKPSENYPIHLINTEGKFIDRVNQEEAKVSAKEIQKLLKNENGSIGIVAFSQKQLTTILNQLPPQTVDLLMDEDYPGFVQSLENVQGDQCDHLIISLGYAKDEDGKFNMRFGPLNQEQGHRRLNVLMSRAKDKITFIRSVKSEDFNISDNEGVEHLRKLMLFLEEEQKESVHKFPKGISLKEKNHLVISSPQKIFENALSLTNYFDVLTSRGWKVSIQLEDTE
tara:strand:- start:145755 stop:149102 length:3348 start_codon:yes stop_codon:yes gene_type:complete